MTKFHLMQYQEDYEAAFALDCSKEDIQKDKDAKKTYNYLKKQGKLIKKMCKLIDRGADTALSLLKEEW